MRSRRKFITQVAALALLTAAATSSVGALAFAQTSKPIVKVSTAALGGLVDAIAGTSVNIVVDSNLPATDIQVDTFAPINVASRVLQKGASQARDRFLDDARNSAPVGSEIRGELVRRLPQLAAEIEGRHRAWARAFARKVLAWDKRLSGKLSAASMQDPHGRIYLLEWAGAKVSSKSTVAGPNLANLPKAPAAAQSAAYEAYIEALVTAIAGAR